MKGWKLFYLVAIIVLFCALITSVYYTLGGFDEVEVFVIEGKERTVIGKEYLGKHNSEAFSKLMQENRSAIDSGRLKGMFTVVFYPDARMGRDSVHCFIGAAFDEVNDVVRLPAGYDYREYRTEKIFKVYLSQHPLARPIPEDVRQIAEQEAIEAGEILAPYWFEMYYEDESLTVEHWAR